jgi:signal transduction histidine kinase
MGLALQVSPPQHEPPHAAIQTELTLRRLQAQERERAWVARELREEIGQLAAAARLNLQQLIDELDAAAQAPRARETALIVEYIVRRVRDLAMELRPSLLDDLGLNEALRWYVERQAQRHSLQASLIIEQDLRWLPEELAIGCYRIAQEAVSNIVRHAQASHCWLVLQRQGTMLHLIISDDGIGFEVPRMLERSTQGDSLGLVTMIEWATLLGGRLQVESDAGRGTELIVDFPLTQVIGPPGAECPP